MRGAESQLRTSVPDSEDVRAELARRRGAEIQHREEIARYQKTIDGLRQELVAKSVQAAAEINRRDGRIEELQKAYANLERQRNEIFERFAQTNELLQKVSIRLADFESRNASLTERLRKQLLEMKRLLRFLDQTEEAAILLRQSRRWKIANPFAALLATMTGRPLSGFGHLDKNVEKYRLWRADHPEMDSLADEIQALRPREILPPYPDLEAKSAAKPASAAALRPPRPETPVSFAEHDQVEISIIIPVYNQFEFTHACLAAVQQNSGEIPYEVIVVDDAPQRMPLVR